MMDVSIRNAESAHRMFPSFREMSFKKKGGIESTVSLFVPGSVISLTQSLEQATLVI